MLDLIIRGGTVVDGTGAPSRTADVAVAGGKIVAIGQGLGAAKRELDASGALVTPGFVDIHTHYDGQASWDQAMLPSSAHGATTVAMGSCGIDTAPRMTVTIAMTIAKTGRSMKKRATASSPQLRPRPARPWA